MVAITVILAAVIGTFVIGLGDDIGNTAPNANIAINENPDDDDGIQFDLVHRNGDTVDFDDLTLLINGTSVDRSEINNFEGTFSAGETMTISVDEGNLSAAGLDSVDPTDENAVALRHDPSGSVLVTADIRLQEAS